MKILIPADLHYPTLNGVATFSRNLARGLAAMGHEVMVIAPSQTGKKHKEVDGNHVIVRTTSVPFPFYQNFRISPNPTREVKKIIKDFDPDVIHIQMLMWIGQAAMKYGNKYGIPIVSTNHAMPENLMDNMRLLAPISRPINYILKAYGARFHAKSDYVTLPTEAAIEMFNFGKIDSPIEAISNGIDLQRFSPSKADKAIYKKFNLPDNRPIVTYIGRLDAEKHVNILITAFQQIRKAVPKAHLLVVGDGTERLDLQEQARAAGFADHATFTGRVLEEDKEQLDKIGSVYVMPSPAELQSIATLEAMASGVPIVAVDAGALRELCQDGRNGYLCAKDDADMIARSVIKILKDKKLQTSFGSESLAIAKTHDLQTTLKRFEAIYLDLINA